MPKFTAGLHALHPERHHVLHGHGLVGEEWLAVPGADQRPVVGVLGLDQGVQVLARREDLTRGLGAVELARVAADGGEFALELGS